MPQFAMHKMKGYNNLQQDTYHMCSFNFPHESGHLESHFFFLREQPAIDPDSCSTLQIFFLDSYGKSSSMHMHKV